MTANVEPSQVIQWMKVLEVRWWEPRRIRMKRYFPGNYIGYDKMLSRIEQLGEVDIGKEDIHE